MKTTRKYVGFWMRVWASIFDTVLFSLIVLPLLFWIYGKDYLGLPSSELGFWYYGLVWVFPSLAVLIFWFLGGATPGKFIIGARVIDFNSGNKISLRQSLLRYSGYFISFILLGFGFFWIAVDDFKRGWHDKLASTAVIYHIKNKLFFAIRLALSFVFVIGLFVWAYYFLASVLSSQLTAEHDVTTGRYIAEGFEYGHNVSTTECWNQTLRRIENCDDLSCKLNQSYFLQACMGASYATSRSYN